MPGLDEVLGGGIPEFSFNLIAGAPGAGKTTLVHQIMFATASPARPALYFTVMGEPAIKVLRHQQQMTFFDPSRLGVSIHMIDLTELALDHGLGAVLEQIVQLANLPYQLSLSMGVAQSTAAQPASLEELLQQADAQMYANKQRTRAARVVGAAAAHAGPP